MTCLKEKLETLVKLLKTLLYMFIPGNISIKYDTENLEKDYFFHRTSIDK